MTEMDTAHQRPAITSTRMEPATGTSSASDLGGGVAMLLAGSALAVAVFLIVLVAIAASRA